MQREHGISRGDYVEQIIFLLFLKTGVECDEHLGEPSIIPGKWRQAALAPPEGVGKSTRPW